MKEILTIEEFKELAEVIFGQFNCVSLLDKAISKGYIKMSLLDKARESLDKLLTNQIYTNDKRSTLETKEVIYITNLYEKYIEEIKAKQNGI